MNPLQADQRMSDAEEILGYDFKDPRWLWEALQAAGSPVTRVGTRSLREGNKQLAGLGDRIISVVIVMTSVDDNISIVVGAVFKDGGLDAAEEVIEHLGIIDLLRQSKPGLQEIGWQGSFWKLGFLSDGEEYV
ncbi:hypothetical protein CGMCC3_g17057 [Colletotrichum fructicola]|nr:uncharacterized protein CGMCC3_g17057 [Colletotrichum fructicola]KAE9566785.1 hypothetical protein CGMCC3_g17057 [Colletotrichum fructicola]KAF4420202.1 hypothetical protein CFRS1_v015077 [Colletotrichum fructicola]